MKRFAVALLIVLFASGGLYASGGSTTIGGWLKSISHKLKLIKPQDGASKKAKDAVAGIKGAEQPEQDGLYWKEVRLSPEEVRLMESALKDIKSGDNSKAIERLSRLVRQYPDSPLADDARRGIKLLKAEGR